MADAPRTITLAEMVAALQRHEAKRIYRAFGIRARLDELGVDPGTVKRKPGRPAKAIIDQTGVILPTSPRHIVQLVLKQKLQAGLPFTSTNGDDGNPCFAAVAKNLKMNAGDVRKLFYQLPQADRDRMEVWLSGLLNDAGALADRPRRGRKKTT